MIKNVVVAGGGVLGSQIALQTAANGFHVTLYDAFEKGLTGGKEKIQQYIPRYEKESKQHFEEQELKDAADSIAFTTDIEEAAKDADLVIEAIVERLDIKKSFYKDLNAAAPEHTIFATNTSTLKPSDYREETGRPEQFLALHFANEIWHRNTAEVMRTDQTSDETFDTVIEFSKQIGMVPIPIYKEHPAYVLNSLLNPYLTAALSLLGDGVASAEEIDKLWMKATGYNQGPFGVIDHVGLATPKNVIEGRVENGTLAHDPWVDVILDKFSKMIDEGHDGKLNGQGFYDYSDTPAFEKDDFLDGTPDVKLEDWHTESDDEEKAKAITIYNTIMDNIVEAGLSLYANGISEAKTIDQVWEITRDLDWGPFGFIEKVGLDKVKDVFKERYGENPTDEQQKILDVLDEGKFE